MRSYLAVFSARIRMLLQYRAAAFARPGAPALLGADPRHDL